LGGASCDWHDDTKLQVLCISSLCLPGWTGHGMMLDMCMIGRGVSYM
jgi:hypothetical protein